MSRTYAPCWNPGPSSIDPWYFSDDRPIMTIVRVFPLAGGGFLFFAGKERKGIVIRTKEDARSPPPEWLISDGSYSNPYLAAILRDEINFKYVKDFLLFTEFHHDTKLMAEAMHYSFSGSCDLTKLLAALHVPLIGEVDGEPFNIVRDLISNFAFSCQMDDLHGILVSFLRVCHIGEWLDVFFDGSVLEKTLWYHRQFPEKITKKVVEFIETKGQNVGYYNTL